MTEDRKKERPTTFGNSSVQRKYQNAKSVKKYQQETKSSKLKKKSFKSGKDQAISVNQLIGKHPNGRSSKRTRSSGLFRNGVRSEKFGRSLRVSDRGNNINKFHVSNKQRQGQVLRPPMWNSGQFENSNQENVFGNF